MAKSPLVELISLEAVSDVILVLELELPVVFLVQDILLDVSSEFLVSACWKIEFDFFPLFVEKKKLHT